MLEGPSGLLNIWPPSLRDRVHWYPSRRRLELPNGAMCTVFSSEEPAQLRGPQVHASWADEIATYKQVRSAEDDATAWENLRIATRLGSLPQVLGTTTPKRVPLLRTLLKEYERNPDKILIRRGRTRDNRFLSQAYMDVLEGLYGGTALGRQELEGEMLDDVVGAMTSEAIIDRYRLRSLPPNMPWIKVVSVDPTVAERPHDECGIVVLYITRTWPVLKRHACVVDDLSGRYTPTEWGDIALRAAHEHGATVIAETNQGGNLVFQMLRQAAQSAGLPMPPMKEVWSSKNKAVRAEPVSGAYARGRVHHINVLAEYESQLTSWVYGDSGYSPDRMDAGVQGLAAGLFPEAVTSGMPGTTLLRTAAKEHIAIERGTALALPRRGGWR
jgi:phage terminase large subunit-like protein